MAQSQRGSLHLAGRARGRVMALFVALVCACAAHAQDAPPVVPEFNVLTMEPGWDTKTSPSVPKGKGQISKEPLTGTPSGAPAAAKAAKAKAVGAPALRGTSQVPPDDRAAASRRDAVAAAPNTTQTETAPEPAGAPSGAQPDVPGAPGGAAATATPAAPDAAADKPASDAAAKPDAVPADVPDAVPAAVPAAAEADAAQPADANAVTLGIYINDIQDLDFRTNSYIVDLYMWFRWTNKDADPVKSVEFMNVYDPEGQQKTVLLDAPKAMPDGSLYNIVRFHGRFSKKFRLEKYPFDRQQLDFVIEDSVAPASEQVFKADTRGISMNPNVSLPGFKFGVPALTIAPYTYPTDFGDLSAASAESYSRAVVSVPITRPMFTLSIKTFGPILLIVICATLVFFINPHFVEGRIGLAITALLTLVAIQFTAAASLPDADYFTMLDKLYMLSYAFIIASLLRVVMTSWQTAEGSLLDRTVARGDHWWGLALLVLYATAAGAIAVWVLTR